MAENELQRIISDFSFVDEDMRLELLLDHARKLPPVPDRLLAQREGHQIHECMTPVFLWMEPRVDDAERLDLFIDVAEEAPTVQGLMSIIIAAYDGAKASDIAAIPADLLQQLGLARQIRMQRAVGFSGIIGRLRRMAEAVASGNSA